MFEDFQTPNSSIMDNVFDERSLCIFSTRNFLHLLEEAYSEICNVVATQGANTSTNIFKNKREANPITSSIAEYRGNHFSQKKSTDTSAHENTTSALNTKHSKYIKLQTQKPRRQTPHTTRTRQAQSDQTNASDYQSPIAT